MEKVNKVLLRSLSACLPIATLITLTDEFFNYTNSIIIIFLIQFIYVILLIMKISPFDIISKLISKKVVIFGIIFVSLTIITISTTIQMTNSKQNTHHFLAVAAGISVQGTLLLKVSGLEKSFGYLGRVGNKIKETLFDYSFNYIQICLLLVVSRYNMFPREKYIDSALVLNEIFLIIVYIVVGLCTWYIFDAFITNLLNRKINLYTLNVQYPFKIILLANLYFIVKGYMAFETTANPIEPDYYAGMTLLTFVILIICSMVKYITKKYKFTEDCIKLNRKINISVAVTILTFVYVVVIISFLDRNTKNTVADKNINFFVNITSLVMMFAIPIVNIIQNKKINSKIEQIKKLIDEFFEQA